MKKIRAFTSVLAVATLVSFLLTPAENISAQSVSEPILRVAIANRPPFSFIQHGKWQGINVDILNDYATSNGVKIEYREYSTVTELLHAVQNGTADIAVGSISITTDRKKTHDFTDRYFTSGLSIAVPKDSLKLDYIATIRGSGILTTLAVMLAAVMLGSIIIWHAENKHYGDEALRAKRSKGYRHGFWWTFGSVFGGPFDLAQPKSKVGGIVALSITIFGVFAISIITAQFASALTTKKLTSEIQSMADLIGRDVVVVEKSSASTFLSQNNVQFRTAATPSELYEEIKNSSTDAAVHDMPLLQYQIASDSQSNISIVGEPLNEEGYGFVVNSKHTTLQKTLNETIINLQSTGQLNDFSNNYFQ